MATANSCFNAILDVIMSAFLKGMGVQISIKFFIFFVLYMPEKVIGYLELFRK